MLTEMTIAMLTLFSEGSICKEVELRCIARVMQVRSEERKISIRKVCIQPNQFSCWNGFKAKREILRAYRGGQFRGSPVWKVCHRVLLDMYANQLNDLPRWNHYYNPALVKPDAKAWKWIKQMKDKKMVGHHVFGRID
jgi:hypothetical protein